MAKEIENKIEWQVNFKYVAPNSMLRVASMVVTAPTALEAQHIAERNLAISHPSAKVTRITRY